MLLLKKKIRYLVSMVIGVVSAHLEHILGPLSTEYECLLSTLLATCLISALLLSNIHLLTHVSYRYSTNVLPQSIPNFKLFVFSSAASFQTSSIPGFLNCTELTFQVRYLCAVQGCPRMLRAQLPSTHCKPLPQWCPSKMSPDSVSSGNQNCPN